MSEFVCQGWNVHAGGAVDSVGSDSGGHAGVLDCMAVEKHASAQHVEAVATTSTVHDLDQAIHRFGTTRDGDDPALGMDEPITKTGIVLKHGQNVRDGKTHEEYHAPCGCAFHEYPHWHWHPCQEHSSALRFRAQGADLAIFNETLANGPGAAPPASPAVQKAMAHFWKKVRDRSIRDLGQIIHDMESDESKEVAERALKWLSDPSEEAEVFIQAAIDDGPEPLQRLGRYLADVLDEDQWKTAERMLLGALLKDQWQPISTAPKDGTHIVIALFSDGMGFGYCGDPPKLQKPWQDVAHWHEDGFYSSTYGGEQTQPFEASHWQPLLR